MARVVLDVNVNVAAVVGRLGHARRAVEAWRAGRFTYLTSEHIITHTTRKLRLPRIARYHQLTGHELRLVEAILREQATLVSLTPEDIVPVTGDPEDDAVLATALLGQADYLVTGDGGLLALGTYVSVGIVTPRRFIELLDEQGDTAQ